VKIEYSRAKVVYMEHITRLQRTVNARPLTREVLLVKALAQRGLGVQAVAHHDVRWIGAAEAAWVGYYAAINDMGKKAGHGRR
jgi:hypothetical protein